MWSDSRSIERKGIGKIPAVFHFDERIGSQRRCSTCTALVEEGLKKCQVCGNVAFRTIEERIRGWVGVQRFDDTTEFGVDLIRNGRAIRIGEKAAFFEFTDEFKRTMKDYPIDGTYGRIIGEVHLNHVPVDFLKQDFQRSSPEWLRTMVFLRGESSLQPNQPGADRNKSPVYKLYQGYRRVRNFGRADMYMGVWNVATDGPSRISRDVEKEYYAKFLQKQPGFFDDAEWWKLVEKADKRPLEELVECSECAAQNLKGHDACVSCGAVLIGKKCINSGCGNSIHQTASSCPHCGKSQVPEIVQPWTCLVCGTANHAELSDCSGCVSPKGTLNPLSRERLLGQSSKVDDLSIPACTIVLADGTNSSPLDIDAYATKESIIPKPKAKSLPMHAIKTPERIEVFLDLNHPLFKSFRVQPEQLIASEVALVLYDSHRSLSGQQYQGLHTLSTLAWLILQSRWRSTLEDGADRVRSDINTFFDNLRERLPVILKGRFEDIYEDFAPAQQKLMVDNMLSHGADLMKLPQMRSSGQYLNYIDENSITELFRRNASAFFDGTFWNDPWRNIGDLPGLIIEDVQNRTKSAYLNCLEDLVCYLKHRQPDPIFVQRARTSLILLQQKLA
jgi:hypothetical protein